MVRVCIEMGNLEAETPCVPHLNKSAQIRVRPGSNHSQSNFVALWPTDPIFSALKDLNLLQMYIKNQMAGSILKVFFPS